MAAYRVTHAFSQATNVLRYTSVRGLSVSTNQQSIPSSYIRGNGQLDVRLFPIRSMSGGGGKPRSFIAQFIDNIRQDISKNKEMKDSLSKFREEAQKLEESEALKDARRKYEKIESETVKGSAVIKERLSEIKDKVQETVEEVQKTEIGKKAGEFTSSVGSAAGKAAESLGKSGEQIAQSQVFKTVSQGVVSIKQEIDETTLQRARIYKAPAKLKKRKQRGSLGEKEDKPLEADEETIGMVLHKDSKWFESWQNFKDNNQYVNKMFDLKMKYDESDHVLIRATRTFTDKMSELFGGVFSKTEMSEVLTEICKMDPNFDKESFIKECEQEIIPNVLEAIVRGELEILKDWCHEAPYNVISHPIKQALGMGYKLDSRVLDVTNVDIAAGKMMEQGPMLVISFIAQQIMSVRDKAGQLVEGDPEKIQRVMYVWALCRDQTELDPKAAWKVMDISASASEQWL
ncbi:mitochondrial import inner membrane translocase subunit TIM44-like [Lineus longissimus]|uniref:mitochondrial import inner membrane translocase subunit TIM44-like n=1 Tax=Lineus longissimus TaxID=88925 RepID=UPI002B4E5AF3